MAANNSLTDIRYKLILRCKGELSFSDSFVAPDNPFNLTAAEKTAFLAYRKAWVDIAFGDISAVSVDQFAEMLISGFTHPDIPDGWCIISRSVGDLPAMCVRISELDSIDATNPTYSTGNPDNGME